MTKSLLISHEAEDDIREAFIWYSSKNQQLADLYESEVSQALSLILSNPLYYQVRYDKIHVKFLARFPYGIHYRIAKNVVVIIGVYHTHRSPRKWRKG